MILSLPHELIESILSLSIAVHAAPSHILAVCPIFQDIGNRVLYTQLCFKTVRQLSTFSSLSSPVPYLPREISVILAGGLTDFNTFQYLGDAFRRCIRSFRPSEGSSASVLSLDGLYFCLNSHASSPSLHQIYESLSHVNPRSFTWMGPDPGHHFSIAIVPGAAFYLFQAIATWSAIEYITITNIAFASDHPLTAGQDNPLPHNTPLLPVLPRLRVLQIERAAFLPSAPIAAMACLQGRNTLELIRVVDAYEESIWGRRLRRSDIEKAALTLPLDMTEAEILQRVRRLVRCEARHERIMGGDRSEGLTVLE